MSRPRHFAVVLGKGGSSGPRSVPITISRGKGFSSARQVSVDSYGNILKVNGDIGLSYLLGSATRLVVEPLTRTGENRWQRDNDVVLSEIESFGPFGKGATRETRSAARETVTYEVAKVEEGAVHIKKSALFQTTVATGGGARIQMQGSGTLVFDTQRGLLKSCDYRATLQINEQNISVSVPITIAYNLLSADEAAGLKKQRAERLANLGKNPAELLGKNPITDEEITKALADLKGSGIQVYMAADRLAGAAPVEERRAEVAAELEKVAKSSDGQARSRAVKALGVWVTAKQMGTLVQALVDGDPFVKGHAFDALAVLKDPKAAVAVASLLPNNIDRGRASASLKGMGAAAEKAVIPYLRHTSTFVRTEACRILAEIGTRQSLAGLKAAAADRNGLVAREAASALQAIEARK